MFFCATLVLGLRAQLGFLNLRSFVWSAVKKCEWMFFGCFFLCFSDVFDVGCWMFWMFFGFSEPAQFCLECGQEVRMDVMQSNDRGWQAC